MTRGTEERSPAQKLRLREVHGLGVVVPHGVSSVGHILLAERGEALTRWVADHYVHVGDALGLQPVLDLARVDHVSEGGAVGGGSSRVHLDSTDSLKPAVRLMEVLGEPARARKYI